MKPQRLILATLALILLLVSCNNGTSTPLEITTSTGNITTTKTETAATTTTTAPVTVRLHDFSVPEPVIPILLSVDPLLIRWGSVVENSLTGQAPYGHLDENRVWHPEYMDFVAVEVELLHAYLDRNHYGSDTELGNMPDRQFFTAERLKYIWIPQSCVQYVAEGEQAIVFLQEITMNPERMNWKGGSIVDHDIYYSVTHGSESENICPGIIPIQNGALTLQKEEQQSWSAEVSCFLRLNETIDDQYMDAPAFVDGMTLAEFSQLIDAIKAFN